MQMPDGIRQEAVCRAACSRMNSERPDRRGQRRRPRTSGVPLIRTRAGQPIGKEATGIFPKLDVAGLADRGPVHVLAELGDVEVVQHVEAVGLHVAGVVVQAAAVGGAGLVRRGPLSQDRSHDSSASFTGGMNMPM